MYYAMRLESDSTKSLKRINTDDHTHFWKDKYYDDLI